MKHLLFSYLASLIFFFIVVWIAIGLAFSEVGWKTVANATIYIKIVFLIPTVIVPLGQFFLYRKYKNIKPDVARGILGSLITEVTLTALIFTVLTGAFTF